MAPPDSVEEVKPELFFALSTLLHDQTLESPAIDSSNTLNLEDVAETDIKGDYLNQKRSCVKACVQKFAKDQAKLAKGPCWRHFCFPGT